MVHIQGQGSRGRVRDMGLGELETTNITYVSAELQG